MGHLGLVFAASRSLLAHPLCGDNAIAWKDYPRIGVAGFGPGDVRLAVAAC